MPDLQREIELGAQERIARLEKAVRVMSSWLVQAQTGFGVQDARGIEAILDTGLTPTEQKAAAGE